MAEELKQVTAFMAGLGQIDIRTKSPHDEIVKEFRGEGENCHPTEAILVGIDEMDNIVDVHLTRHNVLGYVIRPWHKPIIEKLPGPGSLVRMP